MSRSNRIIGYRLNQVTDFPDHLLAQITDLRQRDVAIGVSLPGVDNQYILLTIGVEGILYRHIIDMDQPGNGTATDPKGDVIEKNVAVLAGPFVQAMAVVSDTRSAIRQVYLYMLRKESDTEARVAAYSLGTDLDPQQVFLGEVIMANTGLPAHMDLTADGSQLSVLVSKGDADPVYGLATEGAELQIYQVLQESEARGLKYIKSENFGGTMLVNSVTWGPDSRTLYYTTSSAIGGEQLHRFIPMEALAAQEKYTYVEALPGRAIISMGGDDNIWLATAGAAGLALVNEAEITTDALTVGGSKSLSGPLPGSPHVISGAEQEMYVYRRELDSRVYELTDHLGNVRATVGDRLYAKDDGVGNTIYEPELLSYSDYFPFGSMMPGRTFSSEDYTFGFNGKMKDDQGEFGNTHYDYGFRIYNPVIAKFLSVDPLTKEYPWYTPYQFAGNNPLKFIDLDGLEPTDPMLFWKPRPDFELKTWGDLKGTTIYETMGIHSNDAYFQGAHKMFVSVTYNDDPYSTQYHYFDGGKQKWIKFNPHAVIAEDVADFAVGSIVLAATTVAGLQNPTLGKELLKQLRTQFIGNAAVEGLDAAFGDKSYDVDEVFLETIKGVDVSDGIVTVLLKDKGYNSKILKNLLISMVDVSATGDVNIDKEGDDIIIDFAANMFIDSKLFDKLPQGKYHNLLKKAYKTIASKASSESKKVVEEEKN